MFFFDWGGQFPRGLRSASGSTYAGDAAGGYRRGLADPYLFHGLYGARGRVLPFFCISQLVHVFHADSGAGRELRFVIRGLGRRGASELFADRVLFFAEVGGGRGEKSIYRKSHW